MVLGQIGKNPQTSMGNSVVPWFWGGRYTGMPPQNRIRSQRRQACGRTQAPER